MDLHYPLRDFQKFLNEAKSRGLKSGPEASPVSEWTQEAVNILSGFGKRQGQGIGAFSPRHEPAFHYLFFSAGHSH